MRTERKVGYRERDGQARREMRDANVEENAKTIVVKRERREEEKKTRKREEKLLLIKFAQFECGGSWHGSPPAVWVSHDICRCWD